MNLEKKIERYATQLQEMKSRMAKWQARRDCIKQLETRLKDQAAAFAEQEDAWEKEAMAMSSQFQRTPNKFQNTVVHNAGRDELERQRNKEALRQMIHGAADFEDEGAGDDLGDVRKSRRQRLLLLVRRFNPLVHDIKQIDARFGSSVSAYFGFCRWVMLNYLLLLVPTLYNVAIHVVELASQVYLTAVCACFLCISSHKWLREDRVAKLVHAADERHQSTCWGLIVLLTVFSSKLQLTIKQQVPALTAYATSIVPLGAAVINGALPPIISTLTKFERWDDQGFEIKAMVTRLFLAKVLNILIQLWSYGMLLDPYMLTTDVAPFDWLPLPFEIRSSVMIKFKGDTYACRAEQVASGLIILVWTDFVVSKVSGIATASVKIGLAKIHKYRLKRKNANMLSTSQSVSDTRAEFVLAPKMVALMYSCTLYQFSIPLAPVTAVTSLVMLVLSFKFDKFYLHTFQKKPVTPWSAKDAGTFFIKLYWSTVLIFLGCMYWFVTNTTLPKLCSLQEANISSSFTYFMSQVGSTDDLSECKTGYPACVCSGNLACGPFVHEYAGYGPLAQLVSSLKDQESKSQLTTLLKKLKAQDKKLKLQRLQN
ncbi:hypothetical protein DYB36_001857 [Aphanomyces astaci]|uniref:Uncharacterized protein n=2 Tax=Aphanomyces astaci TaxID=112090 RepID=A0A397B8Z0_APHAT|nr:hypothetical protein DYB36_001857 [Aphanomyces astaci]